MTETFTLQEAIADNLIGLVNAADGIDSRSFAEFLEAAARRQAERIAVKNAVEPGHVGSDAYLPIQSRTQ